MLAIASGRAGALAAMAVIAACSQTPSSSDLPDEITDTSAQAITGVPPGSVPQGPFVIETYQDTYVEQAPPNRNHGLEPVLAVSTKAHALVYINNRHARLPPFVPGAITSAELTVTIAGTATDATTISVHRLTQGWTEEGATWRTDGNGGPWEMKKSPPPYVEVPTATATVTSGQTGTITFDVLPDVLLFNAVGSTVSNDGWIIRLVDENGNTSLDLGSREAGTPATLTLRGYATATSRLCRTFLCSTNPVACGIPPGRTTPPPTRACELWCQRLGGRHPITNLPCVVPRITSSPSGQVCTCSSIF